MIELELNEPDFGDTLVLEHDIEASDMEEYYEGEATEVLSEQYRRMVDEDWP
jgi:hypothetical protein